MRNPFGVTLDNIPDADTISPSGSDIQRLYEVVSDCGVDSLAEVGRQSVTTMINAWRDFTDMSYILARLQAGDASVLNVRPDAFYSDCSGLSYDHRAALETVQSARTYFDNLPDEVRSRFDDSFERWFGEAGDPSWVSKMVKAESAEAPVEEIKEGE